MLVAVLSVLLAIGPLLLIIAFFRPDLAPIVVQEFVFSVTGDARDAGTDAGPEDEELDAGPADAGADAGRRRGHGPGHGRTPGDLQGLEGLGPAGSDPLEGL